MNAQILRVHGKLEEFRRKNAALSREHKHGFQLGPRLAEARLLKFEADTAVRIPKAFRRFCLVAGDGGAGPAYGLLPFAKWEDDVRRSSQYYDCNYIARPCPLWPGMPECVGELDSTMSIWDQFLAGTMTIASAGCSNLILLIVTGKYRGRIVYVNEEVDGAAYMTADTDFLAWYERWIDTLRRGWTMNSFGYGLQGDAPAILQVLEDEASSDVEREEALLTIVGMPDLIDGMPTQISKALASPVWFIRSAALSVVEKHRVVSPGSAILTLSTDRVAEVRRMAAYAIRSAKPPAWRETLVQMLDDTVHDVMFLALCGLLDAKALTEDDLRPLIESSDAQRRSSGLFAWGKMGFDHHGETWLEARMSDSEELVRYEFVMCADKANWDNRQLIFRQMLGNNPSDEPFIKPRLKTSLWSSLKEMVGGH